MATTKEAAWSPGKTPPTDERTEARTFAIVRYYLRGGKRTIRRGLTLAEAKAHCADPETSSTTATSAAGLSRTRLRGPWFDGFTDAVRRGRAAEETDDCARSFGPHHKHDARCQK